MGSIYSSMADARRCDDWGRRLNCAFCGDCGSRLWHESAGPSDTVNIKAGALDAPVDAEP
jgi:hypothetical protein